MRNDRSDDVTNETAQSAARRLERIVDDEAAQKHLSRWVYDELTAGRTPGELTAELEAAGWGASEVACTVEQVQDRLRSGRRAFPMSRLGRARAAARRERLSQRAPFAFYIGGGPVGLLLLALQGLVAVLHWFGAHEPKWSRRRRQGLCPACGYNLTGNLSGVCPECGLSVGSSR